MVRVRDTFEEDDDDAEDPLAAPPNDPIITEQEAPPRRDKKTKWIIAAILVCIGAVGLGLGLGLGLDKKKDAPLPSPIVPAEECPPLLPQNRYEYRVTFWDEPIDDDLDGTKLEDAFRRAQDVLLVEGCPPASLGTVTAIKAAHRTWIVLVVTDQDKSHVDTHMEALVEALNGALVGRAVVLDLDCALLDEPEAIPAPAPTPAPTSTPAPIAINCSTEHWNVSDPEGWNATEAVGMELEQEREYGWCNCTQEEGVRCGQIMAALYHVLPWCSRPAIDQPGTCQNWARQWLSRSRAPSETLDDPTRLRQRYALAVLYCQWNGPNWVDQGLWLKAPNECDWLVSSHQKNKHNDFASSPHCNDQGHLTSLRLMGFGSNRIEGYLPADLALLTGLTTLTINASHLYGGIPSCYRALSNLESIDLSGNALTGPFPSVLTMAPNLTHLNLMDNCFTSSIAIPAPLPLFRLQDLRLTNNPLTGTIPKEFDRVAFRHLHLGQTFLQGYIPSLNLSRMETLDLHGNSFRGEINLDFGSAPNLQEIALYDNPELTGDVNEVCRLFDEGSLYVAQADLSNVACECCGNGDIFKKRRELVSVCRPINWTSLQETILPPLPDHDHRFCARDPYQVPPLPSDHADDPESYYSVPYTDPFYGRLRDSAKLELPTTKMDPYDTNADCQGWSDQLQPHVHTQCECDGKVSIVAEDIEAAYEKLKTGFWLPLYNRATGEDARSLPDVTSCHPQNMALLWLASSDGQQGGDPLQRYVLAVLFFSTMGPDWNCQTNWLSDSSECDWYGVFCNHTTVSSLSLDNNNVYGDFPIELQFLPALRNLSISHTHFVGGIPTAMYRLPLLQELKLNANSHFGSGFEEDPIIPTQVGLATNLVALELSGYSVGGTLPSQVGLLTELTSLRLGYNQIEGTLPTEIGSCAQLRLLELDNNFMNGTIPTSFWRLANLEHLVLSNNAFGGTLPTELGQLTALRGFRFVGQEEKRWLGYSSTASSQAGLLSSLPSELGLLTHLERIELGGHYFRHCTTPSRTALQT